MKFENIIRQTQEQLKVSLFNVLRSKKYKPIMKNGFLFAQGKVPVLLVAHLDTVHKTPVKDICYSDDKNIIMSPQGIGGDDRCGVFMIMEIINTLHCSVLFCEDEELGCIGANKFIKSGIIPKNINYIIEIDRMGSNDAVFYDCENPDFTNFILSGGFREDYGSYSDISEIAPHLGVAAVNISSGYYNAHTKYEYINMEDVKNNIYKISKLIEVKTEVFKYIPYFYSNVSYLKKYNKYNDYEDYNEYYNSYNPVESKPKYNCDDFMIIKAMPVLNNGFVIYHNGEMDDGDDVYIDKWGSVYVFSPEEDYYYIDMNIQVMNNNNLPLVYDNSKAEEIIAYVY